MRPKKTRRRGNGHSPARTSPVTPTKPAGRRGRPPSKCRSNAIQHPSVSSHENNHNSVSPEHSRTSSSDQDAYHNHPVSSKLNANPVHPPDIAGVPTNSNVPPSYFSPNDAFDRPRKLAKRERRAIIKYNRRSRAVIDESFVAVMNELSTNFYMGCNIGLFKLQPIPRASDPSNLVPTLPPPQPNPSPRAGRGRGRRGRRSLTASAPAKPVVTSFSPLCLPSKGLPHQLKPPTTKLDRLSQRCVRRFLKAANVLLIPSTTVSRFFEPHDPSLTIFVPPPPLNLPSSQSTSVSTTTTATLDASITVAAANSTAIGQLNGFVSEIPASNSNPPSSTIATTTTPISPNKRGRGRPPKASTIAAAAAASSVLASESATPKKSASPQISFSKVSMDTTAALLTAQPSVKSKPLRRESTGTSRELKHLLTWDAMVRAGQESLNSGTDPTKAPDVTSPLTLQILPSPTGGEDISDQRTTRGRVRKHSVGPASSLGSVSDRPPSNSSVVKSLSPTGSDLLNSSHFREDLLMKNERSSHRHHHQYHTKGRKRRGTSPSRHHLSASGEATALASPSSTTMSTVIDIDNVQAGVSMSTAPLLPPRKRYKGVAGGPESEHEPVGSGINDEGTVGTFIPPSFRHLDDEGMEKIQEVVRSFEEDRVIEESTSIATATAAAQITQRRPRGRPSKRIQSPSGRPKREAAALGFASMVSSSINSTSVLSMMEESQLVSSSSNHNAVLTAYADDVKKDEVLVTSTSKRGRKPKKPPQGTPSGFAATPPKPRGRPPKHPKPVIEDVIPHPSEIKEKSPTPMAYDIFIELKHPSLVSPEIQPSQEQSQEDQVEKEPSIEPVVSFDGLKAQQGLSKKSKRGRRPNSSTPSPATPAKRRELDLEGENSVIYGSRHLGLFLLRTHSWRRKRKNRFSSEPHASVGPSTTRALLNIGPVAELPSITAFYPFSELTSTLLEIGDDNSEDEKTWTRQLYARLLNTPDLCDRATRLTAPLLSLPCPLRLPDFYRFICVSGLLNNFEMALELHESLQPRILATVSPQVIIRPEGTKPFTPFYPSGAEWPPLCLRDVIPRLSDSVEDFQKLDLLLEFLFRTWEAYAGRKNWVGKQLQQIRSLYSQLRTEHVAKHPDKQLSLPPASLSSGSASKNSGPIIAGSGAARKKVDRQTLERGAEVIRCLCGFRVEGGHVMIRCSVCVTSQHLPCVWWALCLNMNPRLAAPSTPIGSSWPEVQSANHISSLDRLARCRAALIGALAAGGHDISVLCPSAPQPQAYFCPNCLELDGLTKDYPRTLAASLREHNVAAVFEKHAERFEYWSLGTKGEQFLTDEFAIIYRGDFETALKFGGKLTEEQLQTIKIEKAADAVVVRIYGLWKDATGKSWMEGGAFLRPYDLPADLSRSAEDPALWHPRELVYDETSRLILPLSALRGRCSVLAPPTYRIGRPADLPAILIPPSEEAQKREQEELHPLVFLCERLMTRNEEGGLILKDIAPAYLKVITKPYYFLRYPETSALKAAISRRCTSHDLKQQDSTIRFGEIISCGVEPGLLFADSAQYRWADKSHLTSTDQLEVIHKEKEEKSTHHSPQKRRRERSLASILPLLKPTLLSELVSATKKVFSHASRKSPPNIRKVSTRSSPPLPIPLVTKKRGRPPEASKAQLPTPIRQLSFTELQKQMALLGDGPTIKEKSSAAAATAVVSAVTITPKKRGRKPKAAKAEAVIVDPSGLIQGRIKPYDPHESMEGDAVDLPAAVEKPEAQALDTIHFMKANENEIVFNEDTTEGEVDPIGTSMTAEVSTVVSTGLLESVESIENLQVFQHIPPQQLKCEGVGGFRADFDEKVERLSSSSRLKECCVQEEVLDEDALLESTESAVHETLETPLIEEDPSRLHNSDMILSSFPPATHLVLPSRVPHFSVEALVEPFTEEPVVNLLDDVELLKSEDYLHVVESGPNESSSLLRICPPTILEALEEKREEQLNSNSSTSDVSNDGSNAANVHKEQNSSSGRINASSSTIPLAYISSTSGSGSRRRKSSPKKRVFDDPEKILDLSAKSSSGIDE